MSIHQNVYIPTQVSPFNSSAEFPGNGKEKVIYIDKSTDTAYYWNPKSSTYISLGGGSASINWGAIGGDITDQADLQTALSGKVDVEAGKGLSTNDYTNTEKSKLAGIEAGADVNVNADWNATTGDAQILNKPTIPDVSGFATTTYVDTQDALKMDKSVYDPTESGRVNTARWIEIDVINNTGASIPKMSVVYFKTTSSSADTPEILLANANSEATSSKTMGITKDAIANGATGKVILEGEYNLYNTSAYNVGDRLWLSTTNGQMTITAPSAPNHAVFIGIVSRSQNVNGRICIKIQNGYELSELHDVTTDSITTPNDADNVLILDNATSLWKRLSWTNIKATLKTYFDTLYQSSLVSGTNIKTINGSSVLGSGNLTISGGSGLLGIHTIKKLSSGQSTVAAINSFASTTQSTTANRMTVNPYIPATTTNSVSISINVATAIASSNVHVVIYSDLNGLPDSKLYESANIDTSTTGVKTALNNFTFTAGTTYWIGLHVSTSSILISAIPIASSLILGQSTVLNGFYTYSASGVTFGTAPSTFPSGTFGNALPFILMINA